jgi:phosphoribosylformylglycinamidine cyclo-ligase
VLISTPATKPSAGFARSGRSTFTAGVLSDIGSFGGLFRIEPGRYREPVLVASADGVGTKLKVAFMASRT